jgi:PAS domain S-box-containing protein
MEPQRQGTVTGAREAPRKARDIGASPPTETTASRDPLERERQKYFELFELGPDACILTDAEGVIHEANAMATQLLGVSAQFLPGKPLPAFFEDTARAAFRQQLDQLCGSTGTDEWEIKLAARNGMPIHVSVSVARIGRDTAPATYRWLVRDISKRKRAEASARELHRDLELRVAARTSELASANRIKDELLESERRSREEAEISNRIKSECLALLSHEFRTRSRRSSATPSCSSARSTARSTNPSEAISFAYNRASSTFSVSSTPFSISPSSRAASRSI